MSSNLFEGNRVRLRAIEPEDWEFFHQWSRNTDVARLDYEVEFPQTAEYSKNWAESTSRRGSTGDNFRFVIETLNGERAGSLNTHSCTPRHGVFMYGIAVHEAHQRQGYASEAIRLIVRYFFEEKRYQKVNVEVYSFNEPSMRLHERLGFMQEGRLRRMIYASGAHHDIIVYGMTFDDYLTAPQMRISF
ncbi:MAG TPA: GNAT family N-acetyltransferase [Phototrophicaceae bacterium]|jgi:RimJ/RimL family protein N-acetyltransferase|nr:GNAT family N-acetyltransferase [Phototrophicaceae bacterium]